MESNYTGGFWPNPDQILLLQAALGREQTALDAWKMWRSRVNLDDIDGGSIYALPVLHQNLSELGVEAEAIVRYLSVRRQTLYKNRLLFHHVRPVIERFLSHGIPVALLKGSALIQQSFRDPSLRPMKDVDLLIPTQSLGHALTVLKDLGWKPDFFSSYEGLTPAYFRTRHSHGFSRPSGFALDLHWHALMECLAPDADRSFWERTIPGDFEGLEVSILCPAHQALLLAVHGIAWNPVPSLRWIIDLTFLIRTSPGLDWNLLVEEAVQRRLVAPVREALGFLREVMRFPIPTSSLAQLESIPLSRLEFREHLAKTRPSKMLGWLPALWYLYRRSFVQPNWIARGIGFLPYLRHSWMLERWSRVPSVAISKAWANLKANGSA